MAETRVYRNMVCVETNMPGQGGKNWLACLRVAITDTIFFWHKNIMPWHFKPSAVGRYNYVDRTKKYMAAKSRLKHHQRPLVWTGRSEAAAKSLMVIRALNNKGGKGVMTMLPRYFYMRRRPTSESKRNKSLTSAYFNPGPDKADELTRINAEDADRMAAFFEKRLESLLRKSDSVSKQQSAAIAA